MRHTFGRLNEGLVFGYLRVRQPVQPASRPLQELPLHRQPQVGTRDFVRLEVAGAQHAQFARQRQQLVCTVAQHNLHEN